MEDVNFFMATSPPQNHLKVDKHAPLFFKIRHFVSMSIKIQEIICIQSLNFQVPFGEEIRKVQEIS